jgi:hypothetical protein
VLRVWLPTPTDPCLCCPLRFCWEVVAP